MTDEELEAYIRQECADADMTVEEFAEIVKAMTPEEVALASLQIPAEVFEWARTRTS